MLEVYAGAVLWLMRCMNDVKPRIVMAFIIDRAHGFLQQINELWGIEFPLGLMHWPLVSAIFPHLLFELEATELCFARPPSRPPGLTGSHPGWPDRRDAGFSTGTSKSRACGACDLNFEWDLEVRPATRSPGRVRRRHGPGPAGGGRRGAAAGPGGGGRPTLTGP